MVFAITEGGETSFVIGTAWQGLEAGARVVFVYNNPDEVLRAHVTRSREVIDEPRIRKVNLTTGPMAITGSTRMQATSIELLAMLTVLEMALRELLARAGATAPGLGRLGRRAGGHAGGPARAPRASSPASACGASSRASSWRRSRLYRRGAQDLLLRRLAGGRRADRHHGAEPDVLHAVVPQVGRRGGLGVVGVPLHPRRHDRGGLDAAPPTASPQTIEWTEEDLRRAPRRGGRGEAGRDPARDRPARADAVPHRPRRSRSPAGARRRRRARPWWRRATSR